MAEQPRLFPKEVFDQAVYGASPSDQGIGFGIRSLRERYGLSLSAVSRASGLTTSSISKIETSLGRYPNKSTLALLIKTLSYLSRQPEEDIATYLIRVSSEGERKRVKEAMSLLKGYTKMFHNQYDDDDLDLGGGHEVQD